MRRTVTALDGLLSLVVRRCSTRRPFAALRYGSTKSTASIERTPRRVVEVCEVDDKARWSRASLGKKRAEIPCICVPIHSVGSMEKFVRTGIGDERREIAVGVQFRPSYKRNDHRRHCAATASRSAIISSTASICSCAMFRIRSLFSVSRSWTRTSRSASHGASRNGSNLEQVRQPLGAS